MCEQQNLQTRIAGIILAAGQSRRMGRTKQLLPWKKSTILGTVLEQASASCLDAICLVLGAESKSIQGKMNLHGVQVVLNPDFTRGQSTSLKAGLKQLPVEVRAVLFLLGDQPLVSSGTIDQIVRAYQKTKAPIVLPVYQGRRGNPVLIDRCLFPRLMQLEGDTGARAVFTEKAASIHEIPVEEEGVCQDIDTWEDYLRLCENGP